MWYKVYGVLVTWLAGNKSNLLKKTYSAEDGMR